MSDSTCCSDFELGESPRRRKKAKEKTPKKANHRHSYEPVILSYIQSESKFVRLAGQMQWIGARRYFAGKRCTICGKLDYGFPGGSSAEPADREIFYTDINTGHPCVFYEKNYKYNNLPVIRLQSLYPLEKEVFL